MAQQHGPYPPPPPSYGYPPPAPPTHYPPPAPPTNGLAIASLVLSLLGLVGILPLLGTILGLIFGYSAQNQIAQSRGTQGGAGMAKAGIIIGWVTLGIWALAICGVLIFGLATGGLAACENIGYLLQGY